MKVLIEWNDLILTLLTCTTVLGCLGMAPTMNPGWKEISFGNLLKLSAPDDVSGSELQGIDSEVAEWKGKKVTIRIDYGLFSDRLTSYGNRKHYVEREEEISGLPARFVEFEGRDQSLFVAAHFFDLSALGVAPKSVTVVVLAADLSSGEVARQIIQSIEFGDSTK